MKYNVTSQILLNISMIAIMMALIQCGSKKNMAMKNIFETRFEQNNNYSADYFETIQYYESLASNFDQIQVQPYGTTDSGYPLHEVIISENKIFDVHKLKEQGKTILFINNAIHPGEPCGVDASMILARDLVLRDDMNGLLNDIVIVIVPFYNISGALNRGSFSRANQEGPVQYGFRGNVKHLDLNRDFVKCDTKNAQSFNQLFNKWRPEVMIDNHTSNGADYQYTMTLIATQKDQLNDHVASYMVDIMLPELYEGMKAKRYEMTPYVYARETPDEGIMGFLDLPRYSSGYAAIHNTISFMPETHMLKPYADRVWSTYDFSLIMLAHINKHRSELMEARRQADEDTKSKEVFDLRYSLDYDKAEIITFKGYEAMYKSSEVTGQARLYYDRSQPYTKEIPYYNNYKSTLSVTKPVAYVFPKAYESIAQRLIWNGVNVERLSADQLMEVNAYYIESYKDQDAYEGHYLHYDVEVSTKPMQYKFYEGDYIVTTDQVSNNYIMAMLEPQHPDSFFAWNFMDGILMQKEHFSAYVFEDLAADLLRNDKKLKQVFEQQKNEDISFAQDAKAQLNWIYKRSPYYEPGYRQYPIFRVEK